MIVQHLLGLGYKLIKYIHRHIKWVKIQTFMVIIFVMVFSYWLYIAGKFLISVKNDFISRAIVFLPLHKYHYVGEFRITAYSDRVEETDDRPWETSTGHHVNKNTLAVSRDLLGKTFYAGDIVYIEELQLYGVVDDKMAAITSKGFIQTRMLDKFYFDRDTVDKFGSRKCHVYVVR